MMMSQETNSPRDEAETGGIAVSVADYALGAEQPEAVWDFIVGGADDELSLRANRYSFQSISLRPRMLMDVTERTLATSILGTPAAAPIGIAPMAYHRLLHPVGEIATARAASAEGLPLVISVFSSVTLKEIAGASRGPLWFQTYHFRERSLAAELIPPSASAAHGPGGPPAP